MNGQKLIILPGTEPSTASPAGLSYWSEVDACYRQKKLDKIHPELPDDGPARINGARTGSFFHELRRYYNDPKWTKDMVFDIDAADYIIDFQEALRLFREYKKHFPPHEFDQVGLEESFEVNAPEVFGVPILTGQWDGRGHLDEKQLAAYEERRNVDLGGPGMYIWDTKTMGAKRGSTTIEFTESLQMWGYMMAWDFLHPDAPCQGMIVECVARRNDKRVAASQEKRGEEGTGLTEDAFWTIFIPPPTQEQKEIFKANMMERKSKRERIESLQEGDVNLAYCFHWGVCRHLTDGTCDRIPHNQRTSE